MSFSSPLVPSPGRSTPQQLDLEDFFQIHATHDLLEDWQKYPDVQAFVVGCDLDVFLISIEGPTKTIISSSDKTVYYEHPAMLHVLCASVNSQRNFLLLSIVRHLEKEKGVSEAYELILVNLKDSSCMTLDRHNKRCGAKFVHPLDAESLKKAQSHFFVYHGFEKISFWTISFEKKKPKFTDLSKLTIKAPIWHQWDPVHRLLYTLEHAGGGRVQLRCYNLQTMPRLDVSFQTVVHVKMPEELIDAHELDRFPWRFGHTVSPSNVHFQICHDSEGSVCLLQQILEDAKEDESQECTSDHLLVKVFVLIHKLSFDLRIPVSDCNLLNIRKIRVQAIGMHGLLFLYVPGNYAHWFDCAPERGLVDVLRIVCPHRKDLLLCAIGNSLLDLRSGQVLQMRLHPSKLIHLATRENVVGITRILMTNLGEESFVSYFFCRLAETNPSMLTVELIQECIVSLGYRKLLERKLKSSVYAPVSVMRSMSAHADLQHRYVTAIQMIPFVEEAEGGSHILEKKVPKLTVESLLGALKEEMFKMSLSAAPTTLASPLGSPTSLSSPSSSRLVSPQRVVGGDERLRSLGQIIATELGRIPRSRVTFNKNTYADSIAMGMLHASEQVFQWILAASSGQDPAQFDEHAPKTIEWPLFHLFLRFQTACLEFLLPLPEAFVEHFTVVGYHLMSPRVFAKYVTNGLFCITDHVLEKILPFTEKCPLAPELQYFLVRERARSELESESLSDTLSDLDAKQKKSTFLPFLAEYHHALLRPGRRDSGGPVGLDMSSKAGVSMIDSEDLSPFYPLDLLLKTLRSAMPHARPAIRDAIQYIVEHARQLPH